MKKAILIPLAMVTMAGAYAAEPQVGSGETNGYKLVWQDLFDAGQLNNDRWTIEVNGDGGGNSELQYYTDRAENVRVGDDGNGNGCLIITARREEYSGRHFTSGRLISNNKVTFTHGKLEAAIRFPRTEGGLWPAFWTMGSDITEVGWPRCGETDIVEMGHQNGMKRNIPDKLFNGACHWGTAWNNTGDHAQEHVPAYSLQDGEFHLFTLIWDNQSIAMYLDLDKYPDNKPYYKMDIPGTQDDVMWPGNYFHKPNFILFNLAIGGHFPGIYDAGAITALNDGNGQQASMYVNYVKIYQKGTPGENETLATLVPGDKQPAGGDDPTPPSNAIAGVDADNAGIPAEYFSLQGVRVSNPRSGEIYVKRQGTAVSKVIF